MADWYNEGMEQFHTDIAEDTEVSLEDVKKVYSFLVNTGFIDYDTEKELLWELYFGEEE